MSRPREPLTTGGKVILVVVGILFVITMIGVFAPSSSHNNPPATSGSSGITGSTGSTGSTGLSGSSGVTGSTGLSSSNGVTGLDGDPSYTAGYNVGVQYGSGPNGSSCQTLWNNVAGSSYSSTYSESSWVQGCDDAVAINQAAG